MNAKLAPSIQDLTALSERFFACKYVNEIGELFVSEMIKLIYAREVIIDVNTYDFSRPPLFSWNVSTAWASRYNDEFHSLNPSIGTLRGIARDGLPLVKRFEELCGEPIEETRFYQEYMRPQQHRHSLVGCQALQSLGHITPNFQILLVRYESDSAYSEAEISLLQLMLPAIAQSTQRVMKNSYVWTSSVLRNAFNLPPKLTEVAALIVNGHSNKEIAEQLDITVGTTKFYAHQIYDLTGTATRSDLCRIVLG